MGSVIKMATSVLLYACMATLISQAAVVGYFWTSGTLSRHKARQIADIMAGVDMISADMAKSAGQLDELTQQVSFEDIVQHRVAKSLDLDLREQAVGKGLTDLRALATQLKEDTRRFDVRREAFNDNLTRLEDGAKGNAINEVRLTLEALRPRQAKDQMTTSTTRPVWRAPGLIHSVQTNVATKSTFSSTVNPTAKASPTQDPRFHKWGNPGQR